MNDIEIKNVKNIYEIIGEHFDNTRVYKWPWIIAFLDNLPDNSLIYDLGCGNGRNMIDDRLNFIGIDNCETFIKICKNKNLNVILGNIVEVPLKNESADALICIAVLHHLSTNDNRLNALLEMKRLIKTNGKILLSVWSKNQPKKTRRNFVNYGKNIVLWNKYGEIYERYYYIFKLDELKLLINKAGLSIINHEYSCGNEIFVLMKI